MVHDALLTTAALLFRETERLISIRDQARSSIASILRIPVILTQFLCSLGSQGRAGSHALLALVAERVTEDFVDLGGAEARVDCVI